MATQSKEDKKQVFVSYSGKDVAKADAIRAALEAAGFTCWIAPRDLTAGTQWGGGIVKAIEDCQAVLVVFSSASNNSPQVAREMELAVSKRKPLIPVRVEDAMPTEDMQYFLGVSHWFNAYAKPIETYLPEIVAATRKVIDGERRSWSNFYRRIPGGRTGQIGLAIGAAVIAVVGYSLISRPHLGMPDNPMAGRWESKGPAGTKACVLDIQKSGQAVYSDDCPPPFTGTFAAIASTKDGTFAPDVFQPGDSGTYLLQGGNVHGLTGAFKIGLFGGLQTRDNRFGVVKWSRIGGSKPLNGDLAEIVPKATEWPIKDTVAIAGRASKYVKTKWQPDAVLMSVDLQPGGSSGVSSGGVETSFEFYSPSQQSVISLKPNSAGGAMSSPSSQLAEAAQALPASFIDLPDAIARAHERGMQGKEIKEAKLEWTGGASCGTGVFAIDNAILPKCRPGRYVGYQWFLESALGERIYVPAV